MVQIINNKAIEQAGHELDQAHHLARAVKTKAEQEAKQATAFFQEMMEYLGSPHDMYQSFIPKIDEVVSAAEKSSANKFAKALQRQKGRLEDKAQDMTKFLDTAMKSREQLMQAFPNNSDFKRVLFQRMAEFNEQFKKDSPFTRYKQTKATRPIMLYENQGQIKLGLLYLIFKLSSRSMDGQIMKLIQDHAEQIHAFDEKYGVHKIMEQAAAKLKLQFTDRLTDNLENLQIWEQARKDIGGIFRNKLKDPNTAKFLESIHSGKKGNNYGYNETGPAILGYLRSIPKEETMKKSALQAFLGVIEASDLFKKAKKDLNDTRKILKEGIEELTETQQEKIKVADKTLARVRVDTQGFSAMLNSIGTGVLTAEEAAEHKKKLAEFEKTLLQREKEWNEALQKLTENIGTDPAVAEAFKQQFPTMVEHAKQYRAAWLQLKKASAEQARVTKETVDDIREAERAEADANKVMPNELNKINKDIHHLEELAGPQRYEIPPSGEQGKAPPQVPPKIQPGQRV